MKILVGLFLAILVISSVSAFPAREGKSFGFNHDAEVIVVPLEKQGGDYQDNDYDNYQGIIDTNVGYGNPFGNGFYPQQQAYYPSQGFYPWNWNFRGFYENFEDALRRMREQVSNSWIHTRPTFFYPPPQPQVPTLEEPEDKGNTTSTVKIIDGHKVVINDTVYKKDTQFGTSIFKVRVIDVQPLDYSTTIAPQTPEVPKEQDDKDVVIGTKFNEEENPPKDNQPKETDSTDDDKKEKDSGEVTTTAPTDTDKESVEPIDSDVENIETVNRETEKGSPEELETSDNEVLSKDIDEPDTVTEAESIIDEHISFEHQNFLHKNTLSHNYQEFDYLSNPNRESFEEDNNDHANDLLFDEQIDSIPSDLSNDIAVNAILADQGAPHNPDAELFSVEEESTKPVSSAASSISYHLPKFQSIKK